MSVLISMDSRVKFRLSPRGHRRELGLLIAAVLAWACGSSPPAPSPTPISQPAPPTSSAFASPQAAVTGMLAWQRVSTATAIVGGSSRGLKLLALSRVPSGLVAVGGDVRGAVVLSSRDGVQWTRAGDNAAFDFATVRGVASKGGSIVAVGTRSGSARGLLWTTTNGLTW